MKHVLICGAGAIGMCSALFLRERGYEVTVLERDAADDDGCSFGNAGMIVPSHFTPLAAPGAIGLGLRWLLDPGSPFYIRPRLDLALAAWIVHFARAANREHVERAAPRPARPADRQPRAVRATRRSLRQRLRVGQARPADALSDARGSRRRDARRAPRARPGPAGGDRFVGARSRHRSEHRHGDHRGGVLPARLSPRSAPAHAQADRARGRRRRHVASVHTDSRLAGRGDAGRPRR